GSQADGVERQDLAGGSRRGERDQRPIGGRVPGTVAHLGDHGVGIPDAQCRGQLGQVDPVGPGRRPRRRRRDGSHSHGDQYGKCGAETAGTVQHGNSSDKGGPPHIRCPPAPRLPDQIAQTRQGRPKADLPFGGRPSALLAPPAFACRSPGATRRGKRPETTPTRNVSRSATPATAANGVPAGRLDGRECGRGGGRADRAESGGPFGAVQPTGAPKRATACSTASLALSAQAWTPPLAYSRTP